MTGTHSEHPGPGNRASALAHAVLAEEEHRMAHDEARVARAELADDRVPGVGAEHMTLRDALRRSGSTTLGVICLAVACADFDQAAIFVLAPNIQDTFHIGDTLIAAITAISGLLIVGSSLPVGYFGDRMKRTRIISVVMAVFAVFVALTGVVQTAWQLGIARFGAGVGRAIEPVKISLLVDTYPIEARGRIIGLQRGAQSLGFCLGPLFAGLIAIVVFDGGGSWRIVWLVLTVPTILAVLWAFRMKEPVRGKNELAAVLGDLDGTGLEYKAPPLANAFARLRNIKTFYFFLIGMAVIGFALISYGSIFSLFLKEHYGYGPLKRGIVLSLTSAGGVIGAVFTSPAVDRMWRKSPTKTVLLGAGFITGFAFTIVGIWMPNVYLMVPFGMLGSASITSSLICSFTVLAAVQPPRMRSQAQALLSVYVYFVGGFGGSLVIGNLSDSLGERTALTLGVPPALVIGSILIAYGARFVKRDVQIMIEELEEERFEAERLRDGGTVPVLQVRNLDFAYGPLQILFDINFDVAKGETLALLGTNGAGKSTLLRAISGLGIPTRGVVRLNGQTLTYADAESRFQDGILQVRGADVFPGLSVEDNLRAALLASPDKWKQADNLMERVFDVFPVLKQRRKQDAASLSGGEQQMCAFGAALMHEPELLLVDELSLGLAPLVVQELLEVVERLELAGLTMIIVEQSLNVAAAVADRAIFIEKGRIRFDGPARELAERGDLARAVFLGGEGG
jgi:ABC-type branched-subunit amino acid transport system ATPase component/predicted MFS family arabinose efflux permease